MKARSHPSLLKAVRALRAHSNRKSAPLRREAVHVFLSSTDVATGRLALSRLTRELKSCAAAELHPMLWRAAQLADSRWRQMALRDASRANGIVLAVAEESQLWSQLEGWVAELVKSRGARGVTVRAFIGASEEWSFTLSEKQIPAKATMSASVYGAVAEKPLPAIAA